MFTRSFRFAILLISVALVASCGREQSSSGINERNLLTPASDQVSCQAASGQWLKGNCVGAKLMVRSATSHDGSQQDFGDHQHGGGSEPLSGTDLDGDGVPNILDLDADGDGIPNRIDDDDDNDSIPDSLDQTPLGSSEEPTNPQHQCTASGGRYQQGECVYPTVTPGKPIVTCPIDSIGAYPSCSCNNGFTYSLGTNTCNEDDTGKPSEFCPEGSYGSYPTCFCKSREQAFDLSLNICQRIDPTDPGICEEQGSLFLDGECQFPENQCPKGAIGAPPACQCPDGADYVSVSNTCEPIVLPPAPPLTCPEGTTPINGNCVRVPITCPSGTQWNPISRTCVEQKETACPDGWTSVAGGRKCIPPACPARTSWDNKTQSCLPGPQICEEGYEANGTGGCDLILACEGGYEKNSAGECVLLPEQCTGGLISDGKGSCSKPEPTVCTNGSSGPYPDCPLPQFCDDGSPAPNNNRSQCEVAIQCSSIDNKASGVYPNCTCGSSNGNIVWDSTLGNGKGGCRNANASAEACENEGGTWKGQKCVKDDGVTNINQANGNDKETGDDSSSKGNNGNAGSGKGGRQEVNDGSDPQDQDPSEQSDQVEIIDIK